MNAVLDSPKMPRAPSLGRLCFCPKDGKAQISIGPPFIRSDRNEAKGVESLP